LASKKNKRKIGEERRGRGRARGTGRKRAFD